jgi:hypothetical protein
MSTINLLETIDRTFATPYNRIRQNDVTVNPFKAYRTWTFNSSSNSSYVTALRAIHVNGLPAISSSIPFNDATNVNGSYQFSIYDSLDHLFYRRSGEPYNTFGQNNANLTTKILFESASVFSIPQPRIGEGIKPASFNIQGDFLTAAVYGTAVYGSGIYGFGVADFNIQSDRYGNLYDVAYDTALIVPGVKYYEGFNEYFDTSRIDYTISGLTFTPGVPTTTGLSESIGLAAKFDGSAYIQKSVPGLYNRDNDYAVSLFVSASNTGTDNQLIIAKASNNAVSQYPFKLELSGSNQIVASVGGASNFVAQITSSATIVDWTHVVLNKTGSNLQLYLDGALENSITSTLLSPATNVLSASARIDNTDDVFIGGYNSNSFNLTGYLDEIRIFNQSLTTSNISALNDRNEATMAFIQTNHVGNIFEKQGLAVLSSVDYRYRYVIDSAYTASYKSTMTIYELGVIVRSNRGTANVSTNPTTLLDDDFTIAAFATGSDFQPYITTIGLYNTRNEMVAVAKLAQPIKKRDDVDINFLVRIDLDKNLPSLL